MIIQIRAPRVVCQASSPALRVLPALLALVVFPAQSRAERILDQIVIIDERKYVSAHGNHSGGELLFGKNYSLQLCDDFDTTSTGYVITEVEVGNLTFGIEQPSAAWVSIYEVAQGDGNGAVPKENALYDARHEVTTNIRFDDPVFGLVGLKTTITGLSIPLSPNTQYFISVQTESGDWAYTALGDFSGKTATPALRDNGRNGYQGGYGWTTWRHPWEAVTAAAYRIEAVPEPHATALLLILAGAASSPRRRRSA